MGRRHGLYARTRIHHDDTATIDPGILRACWGTTVHNDGNLKFSRGIIVRNDSYAC